MRHRLSKARLPGRRAPLVLLRAGELLVRRVLPGLLAPPGLLVLPGPPELLVLLPQAPPGLRRAPLPPALLLLARRARWPVQSLWLAP